MPLPVTSKPSPKVKMASEEADNALTEFVRRLVDQSLDAMVRESVMNEVAGMIEKMDARHAEGLAKISQALEQLKDMRSLEAMTAKIIAAIEKPREYEAGLLSAAKAIAPAIERMGATGNSDEALATQVAAIADKLGQLAKHKESSLLAAPPTAPKAWGVNIERDGMGRIIGMNISAKG